MYLSGSAGLGTAELQNFCDIGSQCLPQVPTDSLHCRPGGGYFHVNSLGDVSWGWCPLPTHQNKAKSQTVYIKKCFKCPLLLKIKFKWLLWGIQKMHTDFTLFLWLTINPISLLFLENSPKGI